MKLLLLIIGLFGVTPLFGAIKFKQPIWSACYFSTQTKESDHVMRYKPKLVQVYAVDNKCAWVKLDPFKPKKLRCLPETNCRPLTNFTP